MGGGGYSGGRRVEWGEEGRVGGRELNVGGGGFDVRL